MRPHQSEPCHTVIKGRCIPTGRGVASGAVGGSKSSSRRRVHRVVRLLPGSQVAAGIAAIRWSDGQSVIVIDVAAGAGHVGMTLGQ